MAQSHPAPSIPRSATRGLWVALAEGGTTGPESRPWAATIGKRAVPDSQGPRRASIISSPHVAMLCLRFLVGGRNDLIRFLFLDK